MRILGIDPGYNGCLCILDISKDDQGFLKYEIDFLVTPMRKDMKQIDGHKILNWLSSRQWDAAYLEEVHAVWGSSAAGTFNFGRALGAMEGILDTAGIEYQYASPKMWQAVAWMPEYLPIKNSIMHAKEKSYHSIKRRFPGLNLKASTRSKNDHDGVIDATLIALYGAVENKFDISGVLTLPHSSSY